MTRPRLLIPLAILALCTSLPTDGSAQTVKGQKQMPPGIQNLPIGWGPGEKERSGIIGLSTRGTAAPTGPIRAAAEWAESEGVFCLWDNASLMNELQKDNLLYIITTNSSWWNNWLSSNGIPTTNVRYLNAPTNTWWVRDYGPWFIWDGNNDFGLVDNDYNRPRPLDDVIPSAIATTYGINYFGMDLTHTGGNYYTDGYGNAFSSRLPYKENPSLTQAQVDGLMQSYLGIETYHTPELDYDIEHFDTFGKPLAPDAMVWGEFPYNTTPWCWSEGALKYWETRQSPYGWPYKITRFPLWSTGSTWTAYINALQTNDKIILAKHNIASDATARAIFESAAPGYTAVSVNSLGTNWGDSVHCRSRNFVQGDAIRIYPQPYWEVADANKGPYGVTAEVIPDNSTSLSANPRVFYSVNGGAYNSVTMSPTGNPDEYTGWLPTQSAGASIEYYIQASDNLGQTKRCPYVAPDGTFTIDVVDDTENPKITHDSIHAVTLGEWPLMIECTALDNTGIPNLTLQWRKNFGWQPTVPMVRVDGTFKYRGQLTGSIQLGDIISYRIKAEDTANPINTGYSPINEGWYYMEVNSKRPICVIDLDKTPCSGEVFVDVCDEMAMDVRYTKTWPSNLYDYDSLIICLGMNPTRTQLNSSQANGLVAYLNSGRAAYMEGGNAWAQDSYRTVYRSHFGVSSASSGADITTSNSIVGVSGEFTAGMSFLYYGEPDSCDHLTKSSSATSVMKIGSYDKMLTYSNGTYSTAAASFQIGSLVDAGDPSHAKLLVARILEHLGYEANLVAHRSNTDSTQFWIEIKGDPTAAFGLFQSYGPGWRVVPPGIVKIQSGYGIAPVYGAIGANGTYQYHFVMPASPSLDGVEIYWQAWMQDFSSGLRKITNRDRVTLYIP